MTFKRPSKCHILSQPWTLSNTAVYYDLSDLILEIISLLTRPRMATMIKLWELKKYLCQWPNNKSGVLLHLFLSKACQIIYYNYIQLQLYTEWPGRKDFQNVRKTLHWLNNKNHNDGTFMHKIILPPQYPGEKIMFRAKISRAQTETQEQLWRHPEKEVWWSNLSATSGPSLHLSVWEATHQLHQK